MEKNQLAFTPNWSIDDRKLVFTIMTEKGKSIAVIDLASGKIRTYLPFGYTEISGPAYYHNEHIIFAADFSGIQNLYAIDTSTYRIYQVSSSMFSSSDPSFTADMKTMVYSDYCSDGMMIAETKMDPPSWIPLEKVKNRNIRLYDSLLVQEKNNIQDSVIQRKIYKMYWGGKPGTGNDSIKGTIHSIRKYSKILSLFNPHSWAPVAFDVNNLTLHPGVMVLSQNTLSTTIASAGYDYDLNEMTGKFFANLSYQGLYPVFDFNFSIGNRAAYALLEPSNELVRFMWQELNFGASISIPWNFSFGKFYRFLTPSIGTTLINVKHLASTPENFTTGLIQSMDYGLSYSQYFRSVPKDIYPKWGQTIHFTYRNTPITSNSLGQIIGGDLTLYFPGIVRHHSFWMYGGYQNRLKTGNTNYEFADLINLPRGYSGVNDNSVYSLMFNYSLPLFYPDWSVTSLFYFKRFKLNLFFDYGEGFNKNNTNYYRSTGGELTADLHILRFLYPFELGVRTIYLPDSQSWQFEFLYAVRY